jgi:hypothetical protein
LSLWEVSTSTPGPSNFSNTTTLSPRVTSFHSSRIKWRYSRAVSPGSNLYEALRYHWNNWKYGVSKLRFPKRDFWHNCNEWAFGTYFITFLFKFHIC